MARIYTTKIVPSASASVPPETFNPVMYKGFSSTDFRKNYKLFDNELVKRDIVNHFYIRKGEKLENPEFGTLIWDLLFESFTDDVNAAIAKDVEDVLNYETRVAINEVIISSISNGIQIKIQLTYKTTNLVDTLIMNFDRGINSITWQ